MVTTRNGQDLGRIGQQSGEMCHQKIAEVWGWCVEMMGSSESHWANPQYILRLQDTDDDDSVCSVIVQLMQKDRRKIKQKGENYHYIGFAIYWVPSGYSFPLTRDFFEQNRVYKSSDNYSNARQAVKRFSLPPGVYVVVPCTYEPDKEADYYIRFFFEKGNVSEYADEPPEKVEVPPPTPSPKYKEQEEQFQKFFYRMSGEVSLDDFLSLMARLMKLFNVFNKYQKNNQATFTLQQWIEESLMA
nr:hypothetical protein BaRGS_026321 [Batillaria attramentaria]